VKTLVREPLGDPWLVPSPRSLGYRSKRMARTSLPPDNQRYPRSLAPLVPPEGRPDECLLLWEVLALTSLLQKKVKIVLNISCGEIAT